MPDEPNAGRAMIVEYETLSGVLIHIAPLSIFTVNAIHARAELEFPYPDPTPYRLPLENAADPSIKLPAEDNPEYRALCIPIDEQRMAWRVEVSIDLACTYPAFPTREALLGHFRPDLEKIRKVAELPADEWQAVLKHCVFKGRHDRQTVINIATQNESILLTPAEVVEGVRFFRPSL